MAGFNTYFHVNAGDSVLKHPLYQKYNMLKFSDIEKGAVSQDLAQIFPTNDNWPIIWYLANIINIKTIGGE